MSLAATDAGVTRGQVPGLQSRRSDWWVPLTVAVLLLGAAILMASKPWVATGDVALMELRLQAMPQDMPLVGVYSRFGWWHPGPSFLVWSWLGYTVGGATSAALVMTMAVLHVAVLVGAWWLARQVNVVAAQAMMVAAMASLLVRPVDQVLTPWNPYVGLTGVALLVAAGWAMACGRAAGAFVLLPWGSFLVQSHVGYAPVVAAVVLTAVALAAISHRWRRNRPPAHQSDAADVGTVTRKTWLGLMWGAIVAAVMWMPPLVQQITGDPGNLGALYSQLGGGAQGLSAGVATLRSAFALPMGLGPDFAGGLPSTTSQTPWLLLLPAAALVVALARRRREQIFAMVLLVAVLVAALVSVAGLVPPAFEYLVPWLPSVVWLTLAWSVWVLADPLLGSWRWWSTLIGAVAVATALVVSVGLSTSPPPLAPYGSAAADLWQAVAADAESAGPTESYPDSAPSTAPLTLLGEPDDEPAQSLAQGMAVLAVAAGADVALDEATSSRVERVVPVDGPGRTPYVVRSHVPGIATPEGYRVVATYDPFSVEQWAQLAELDVKLAQPGLDPLTRLALATQGAQIAQGQRAFQVLAPAA